MNNAPSLSSPTAAPEAICPKCGGRMSIKQVACPHCGYDFPLNDLPGTLAPQEKTGLAYSALADFTLATGIGLSALGAIVSLLIIPFFLFQGQFFDAFVRAPITFFSCFAIYVVLQRVADIG